MKIGLSISKSGSLIRYLNSTAHNLLQSTITEIFSSAATDISIREEKGTQYSVLLVLLIKGYGLSI